MRGEDEFQLFDELESSTFDRRSLLQAGGVGVAALAGAAALADVAAAQRRPTRGGTLRYATIGGASETLAPGRAILVGELVHQYCLFDRLFEIGPSGKILAGLAESATVQNSGRRWIIRLRRGVEFHNGKTLNAADVVHTMKTWTDPLSRYGGFVKPFINFDGIRARDARTIEVPMLLPLAALPAFLAHQNAGIIPNGADPFGQQVVGTGAFSLQSFTPGRQTISVRNQNYWREGQPYVDRVVNDSSYTDEASRINAVLSGAADIAIYADFALAKAQAGRGRVKVLARNANAHLSFVMRLDKRPFTDPRVRLALRLIANRQQLVNQVLFGYGKPGHDLMGPYCEYYASSLKRSPDIQRARSLLRAAGANDLRLELVTNNTAGFTEAATLFQEQARAAGVSISLSQVPSATYYTAAAGWPRTEPSDRSVAGAPHSSVSARCTSAPTGAAPLRCRIPGLATRERTSSSSMR